MAEVDDIQDPGYPDDAAGRLEMIWGEGIPVAWRPGRGVPHSVRESVCPGGGTAAEVDVAPAQRAQLAQAQTGEERWRATRPSSTARR